MRRNLLPIANTTFIRSISIYYQNYQSSLNSRYVNQALSGKENFVKDYKEAHVKTNIFQKVLLGVGSGVISITSPSRGDMIAVLGEVTGLQALKYIHQKMMESDEGRKILEEKPRISSGSIDLEKLKTLPDGTLGKAYSNFLEHYGYTPDTRNSVRFVDDVELAYVAQRYREVHDLFHTILNMPTNMLGEVTVKWVEAIQTKLPMCAAGALFGSVRLGPKFTRFYSTVIRLNPKLSQQIENEELNPKQHSGVMNVKCQSIPDKIVEGINSVLRQADKEKLLIEGEALERKLICRLIPVEESALIQKKKHFHDSLKKTNKNFKEGNEEDERKLSAKVDKALKYHLYNWKAIDYTKSVAKKYLAVRAPAEYAVLKRVFNEIILRDKTFAPKSLFDFGSGVGTVVWVANELWGNTLTEYFCVDLSKHMNDLADLILRNNDEINESIIKNIYYRQFLPATPRSYDIVVSSFSLLELPSLESRLNTITKLWNNTFKYLVLVENGSNSGFKVLLEARNFILEVSKQFNICCHIMAPCPHELPCPRLKFEGKPTPCNFSVKYSHLKVIKKEDGEQKFSFLIFKKEEPPPQECRESRIIRKVSKRKKCVTCQLCTNNGNIETAVATPAKSGKAGYKCLKFSNWGDIVPGVLETTCKDRKNYEELISDEDSDENSDEDCETVKEDSNDKK